MSFISDKQTLDDLNIPGKYRPDSVFSLFNKVVTRGGERLLSQLFQEPLTDHKQINQRAETFRYFTNQAYTFPFSNDEFALMEEYLGNQGHSNPVSSALSVYWKKTLAGFVKDDEYNELHHRLLTTIRLLDRLADFVNHLTSFNADNVFLQQLQNVSVEIISGKLQWVTKLRETKTLAPSEVAKYDYRLRTVFAGTMKNILEIIYQLDVNIAVGNVAGAKGFSYADVLPKEINLLKAVDLKHPCLEKAVGNDISIVRDSNVIFLTGANMAGKSTFMKSLGIAVYLAHMGFPVAAKGFSISVKDGLYTSINVPDNLSMGYSHFYAEVLRVKKVAQEIVKPLDLVIIFDELFKGTNVKDAYDATLAITASFAEKRSCFFVISTHITEAGEELRKHCDNLQFVYFPSLLNGSIPVYTYQLEQGISNDKHGMMIIKKEGILELIEG